MADASTIALPDANPRDREVQHVVLLLVETYAFAEAAAILNRRLREIQETQQTHIETIYLEWRDLARDDRTDFLTFAHHRRHAELRDAQTSDSKKVEK